MNTASLAYCLTETEKQEFEENGFFIVENALSPEKVAALTAVTDRVDAEYRAENGLQPHEKINILDFAGKDELLMELVDWPQTFPKVWGILGWNIQLYHSHMIITPPDPSKQAIANGSDNAGGRSVGWHQDSGRLNQELEGTPRSRISLKVAFFLTDTSVPGRGNFRVVPGSHLLNEVDMPGAGADPDGTVDVRAKPGAAVFFDRRIWHTATENNSDITRKVLFYGYSYRWLRPRDNMTVERFMEDSDPIRQQLLGKSVNGGFGYTSPQEEDVPLRGWIREHVGPSAAA